MTDSISCPYCQIGGYDFCHSCAGSGYNLTGNIQEPINDPIRNDLDRIETRIMSFKDLPQLSNFQVNQMELDFIYLNKVERNEKVNKLISILENTRVKNFKNKLNEYVDKKFKRTKTFSIKDYFKLSNSLMTYSEWRRFEKNKVVYNLEVNKFEGFLLKVYQSAKLQIVSKAVQLKDFDLLVLYCERVDPTECVKLIVGNNRTTILTKEELKDFTKDYSNSNYFDQHWLLEWVESL